MRLRASSIIGSGTTGKYPREELYEFVSSLCGSPRLRNARQSGLPVLAESARKSWKDRTDARPAVVLARVAKTFGGTPYVRQHTPSQRDQSLDGEKNRGRWPPSAPSCSDGIGLSVLPGALRLLGLAPVGCRRLTRSRVNVTAGRIILDASCVVSAPLPVLSGPPLARGHRSEGGGPFLSGPEGPPSAVRGLLAARAIVPGLFGPAPRHSSTSVDPQTLDFSVEPPLRRSWAMMEEVRSNFGESGSSWWRSSSVLSGRFCISRFGRPPGPTCGFCSLSLRSNPSNSWWRVSGPRLGSSGASVRISSSAHAPNWPMDPFVHGTGSKLPSDSPSARGRHSWLARALS